MPFYLPNNVWKQVGTGVGVVTLKSNSAVKVHFGSTPGPTDGFWVAYKTWCPPQQYDGGGQDMWVQSLDVGAPTWGQHRSVIWVSGVGTFDAADEPASNEAGVTPPPPLTVSSVIGFGSSTLVGTGASSPSASAMRLVAAALGASTVRNAAISGTVLQNSPDSSGSPRANNGRDRFASALLGANKSDRVFILYGANDLRYTAAPATMNVSNFSNDLKEVMNGLLEGGYTRNQIVLASPNWYPDEAYAVGSEGFTGSNRTIHEQYVAACADISEEYGVAYADVYGQMRDGGGASLSSGDGIHPNDAGHSVIASAFLSAEQLNTRPATTLLSAAQVGNGVAVSWVSTPGATGYEVSIGTAGSYTYPTTATVGGTSHVFSSLSSGVYRVRIRPIFSDGVGPWSFFGTDVTFVAEGSPALAGSVSFAGQTPNTLMTNTTPSEGTWTRHPLSTGNGAVTPSGAALMGPSSTSQFDIGTLAELPISGGVFVELDFLIRSNSAQLTTYAVARVSGSSLTFIAAGYNGSAWRVLKYTDGSISVVGTYSKVEAIGSTPQMRFEVEVGEQRIYLDGVLVLTTNIPDVDLGAVGDGVGLRVGAGSAAWSSTKGGQVTALRVGALS